MIPDVPNTKHVPAHEAMNQGACIGHPNLDWWTWEATIDEHRKAARICNTCPVRDHCYELAMADPGLTGVLAGYLFGRHSRRPQPVIRAKKDFTGLTHGRTGTYQLGCRCAKCCDLTGLEHGLRSTYNRGCRCPSCRKVQIDYCHQRRAEATRSPFRKCPLKSVDMRQVRHSTGGLGA